MSTALDRPIYSTLVGEPSAERRVVFLHGLFGRGKNFTTIAQGLAPEAQSLLVDLPNHGASGWTQHFDYTQLADLVAEHLQQDFASESKVDVVGHSMGGKVAMVLALRHPELVRRLAVIDIAPVASDASVSEFPHLLSSLASLNLDSLESRGDAQEALREAIPNSVVRGFLLQNLARTEAGFAWQPNLTMLNDEIDAVMGFSDMTGYHFEEPVLWMRGSQSDYVRDEYAPIMRELFPKTRRLTVQDAGHWVHSEKPAETIAALRSFLL